MKVLMCPPLYYQPAPDEDASAVMAEWRDLYRLLRDELDVQVDLLEPRPDMPNLVFAASGGFVWDDSFIASRFRDEARQPERAAWENFFLVRGYATPTLPEGCRFEGERDAVVVGDTLFLGYHSDDERVAHGTVADIVDGEVVSLRLSDSWDGPLDTCLCPLDDGMALYHPEAFDAVACETIEDTVAGLQPVGAADARRLGCNAVAINGRVILPEGCEVAAAQLEQDGFQVHILSLHSCAGRGAGPKALVLKIED